MLPEGEHALDQQQYETQQLGRADKELGHTGLFQGPVGVAPLEARPVILVGVLLVWVRRDAGEGHGGVEQGQGGEDEGEEDAAGAGPFLGAVVGG